MRHRFTIACAAILLVAGCAAPPVPQDQFYRVQVAVPGPVRAEPPFDGVLEVDRLSADGLTAGRSIVYVDAEVPHVLATYHYHFWIEPPTVMLRDQLVAYLRGANIARHIVTPEMRAEPEFVVAGKILRLERVIDGTPATVVELELALRRTADDRIDLVRTYREEVPAAGSRVSDAVIALNQGLERIFQRFTADLAAL